MNSISDKGSISFIIEHDKEYSGKISNPIINGINDDSSIGMPIIIEISIQDLGGQGSRSVISTFALYHHSIRQPDEGIGILLVG